MNITKKESIRKDGKKALYSVGNVIYAKPFEGYPIWPAKVLCVHRNKKEYLIEFFETGSWMLVREEKMWAFVDKKVSGPDGEIQKARAKRSKKGSI